MFYNVLRYVTWALAKSENCYYSFFKKIIPKCFFKNVMEHFLCDDVGGKNNMCEMEMIKKNKKQWNIKFLYLICFTKALIIGAFSWTNWNMFISSVFWKLGSHIQKKLTG